MRVASSSCLFPLWRHSCSRYASRTSQHGRIQRAVKLPLSGFVGLTLNRFWRDLLVSMDEIVIYIYWEGEFCRDRGFDDWSIGVKWIFIDQSIVLPFKMDFKVLLRNFAPKLGCVSLIIILESSIGDKILIKGKL